MAKVWVYRGRLYRKIGRDTFVAQRNFIDKLHWKNTRWN